MTMTCNGMRTCTRYTYSTIITMHVLYIVDWQSTQDSIRDTNYYELMAIL